MKLRTLFIALICLPAAAQTIAPNRPVAVRILYDNSGSMYPGYTPPGTEGRRTREETGVAYFHQHPEFQQWLADFVAAQSTLGAKSVGMWTFTSNGSFSRSDIQQVHPEVAPGEFDVAQAIRNFPQHAGKTTYLTETLDTFTRDYSGVVWLITDNIVETTAGQPDADVDHFFRTLNDDPRFRSVHLFKYPFVDAATGQHSALAVYGILVSPRELPRETLSHYDAKFTAEQTAQRVGGAGPLFPGQEHLKLKDLRIDPLVLRAEPTLTLILGDNANGMFEEGQRVRLRLSGEIKSNLTQHSVTAGHFDLALASPMMPDDAARRELGVRPIAAQGFEHAGGDIRDPIAPGGTRNVQVELQSTSPVSFTARNLGVWLRLALNGAVVRYTGTVRMSFTDVKVHLERARMAGIFGIDRASAIFDFQDVRSLDQITPSDAQVSFALRTRWNRTVVLVIVAALLAIVLGAIATLLSRQEWYVIALDGTPEHMIALRRLASHPIRHEQQPIGNLSRGISGAHHFVPITATARLAVRPAPTPDAWDVRYTGGRSLRLTITRRNSSPKNSTGRTSMSTRASAGATGARRRPIDRF